MARTFSQFRRRPFGLAARERRCRVRRRISGFEQFEIRTLLSVAPGGSLALAASLSMPLDTFSGTLSANAPVFFQINPTADALLVAQVSASGPATRLALLDSSGHLLLESDGQSASDPSDKLTVHLGAGTDYLEVESVAGAETFTLSTNLNESSQPGEASTIAGASLPPTTPTLLTGDFNGDGRADFALEGRSPSSQEAEVEVFPSSNDGSFHPTMPTTLGGLVPGSVVTGDFNGDGRTDLALTCFDAASQKNLVEVLYDNVDGTLQSPQVVDLGGFSPSQVVAGDFNGDGRSDLALAGFDSTTFQFKVAVELGQSDGSFQAGTAIAPGTILPTSLAVGDFNGDGRSDLVLAGFDITTFQNEAEVLLATSGGTFQPTTPTGLGTLAPSALVTGDFTNDGRADVALEGLDVVSQRHQLEILPGNGDGTFQALNTVDLGAFAPSSVVAGNFGGDGRTELALEGFDGSTAQYGVALVQESLTSGTFPVSAPTDLGPQFLTALVAGDFRGDGRTEVAVSEGTSSTGEEDVEVLAANPDGTFQTSAPTVLGSRLPSLLATGDFSGNHHTDLAAAGFNAQSQQNTLAILPGNGDGTFGATQLVDLSGLAPSFLVSGDFNGDGRTDLAVAGVDTSMNREELEVLLSSGGGEFRAMVPIDLAKFAPVALVAGDFNGDGRADLALAGVDPSSQRPLVEIFLSAGDGTFRAPLSVSVANLDPSLLSAVDLTGDGRTDLVIAGFDSTTQQSSVQVLVSNGDGTFQAPVPTSLAGLTPASIVSGNFSGDGRTDLALEGFNASSQQNEVVVLPNVGQGSFGAPTQISLGDLVPSTFVSGNFLGDGHSDLALSAFHLVAGREALEVLLSDGHGAFLTPVPISLGSVTPAALVAADFNDDGRADLAVTGIDASSAELTASVVLGNGNGVFQTAPGINVNDPSGSSAVHGDFNGDGRTDLAVVGLDATADANVVEILLGNDDGTFETPIPINLGAFSSFSLVTADFNGDGRADLALTGRESATGKYAVEILLGNGDGTFRLADPINLGTFSGASIVTGDFNGDGRSDLALQGFDSSSFQAGVELLLGNGDGTFQPPKDVDLHGLAPDSLVAGNFNNDGRTDLALAGFNAVTQQSEVDVLLSVGDGTFHIERLAGLGSLTPAPLVTGDFTGDGHTDIALTASNTFSQLHELLIFLGNGDGTFDPPTSIDLGAFGASSLQAGNFLGDGHDDLVLAAFDPSAHTETVEVVSAKGDGTFASLPQSQIRVDASTQLAPVLLALDLNSDRRTDLVLFSSVGLQVEVSLGTGRFADPAELVGAIQSAPVVADPGDGTSDVFVITRSGQILWRKRTSAGAEDFAPPIVINEGFLSRAITFVSTDQGPLLASVDLSDDAISLYADRQGQFVRVGSLTTGSLPTQVASGDLNGDGIGDLVVLNAGDGSVSVFFGEGAGAFVRVTDLPVGLGVSDMALVDDKKTGTPDLIVSNQLTGLVTVFGNDGKGRLGAPISYAAGAGPYSLTSAVSGIPTVESSGATAGFVVGSFAPGGMLGLATINPGTNTSAILDGLGDGRFANANQEPTRVPATAIASGDFNGDGLSDLALLGSNGVTVEINDGAGGWKSAGVYALGPDATGLSVADINHDGNLDILIGDTNGDVLVLQGNGDGTFQTYRHADRGEALAVLPGSGSAPEFVFADQQLDRVVVSAGIQPTVVGDRSTGVFDPSAAKLADLNGDGIPDMIIVNSGGNNVLIYPGLGNGQFGPELNGGSGFFVGTDPVSVTVGDINNDGRPDLVVANQGSNDVSLLLNQATPGAGAGYTFANGPRLQAGAGPASTVVQDVNGDGVPDILASDSGSNRVTLLPGIGNGFFNDQNPRTFPVGSDPGQILVGNVVPGTGPDIITLNRGSNNITVISGLASGNPVFDTVPTGGTEPVAALAVELPGQSLESLIVANAGDALFTLLGGTDGLQLEQVVSTPGLSEPSGLAFATLSGNEVSFYATTAGVEAAFTLAFVLPGFSVSGGPTQGSSGANIEAPVQLLALSESSLAIVGTLLIVSPGSSQSSTIASASTENTPEVNTTFLSLAPSQGQSLFSPTNGEQPRGDDDAVEAVAATPKKPSAAAPAWMRTFLGIDELFEEIRQENHDAAPGKEEGDTNDERPSQSDREAPADPAIPATSAAQPDDDSPARPRDVSSTAIIDDAIDVLYSFARSPGVSTVDRLTAARSHDPVANTAEPELSSSSMRAVALTGAVMMLRANALYRPRKSSLRSQSRPKGSPAP